MIQIKRIYDEWEKNDGFRILIDRLWPRGVSKQDAHVDLWLKEIAPSTELRKWFDHDVEKWEEFKKRYKGELKEKEKFFEQVETIEKRYNTITLLYGAKDKEHNDAVVLLSLFSDRT